MEMTRVVVVGNGMVGSRFVEELRARDPEGRFAVVVLGAEEYEPYNRVLLSDLVAGSVTAASLALPTPGSDVGAGSLSVARGARVVAVDRTERMVVVEDGRVHRYDHLVLATGSRARIPPIEGIDPRAAWLPPGVHALRTLDDAREIVAATLNATRAVVVGAGVLGLEVATGLARRGLAVTVVHPATAVMERQLDAGASAVLVAALSRLGVEVLLPTTTEAVLLADSPVPMADSPVPMADSPLPMADGPVPMADGPGHLAGRVRGVRLADGRVLPAELVIVATGTVPEAQLARDCGLAVDRGVLVGSDLSTPDDARVHAIGDCAQPPEGGSGLIAQGWDQARRLAVRLAGAPAAPPGPPPAGPLAQAAPPAGPATRTDVVRVKASGLDIVAMGICGPRLSEPGDHRAVRLADPAGGRLVEVVVADGLVVGATCIGAGAVAADLTAAYTRGSPAPRDPAHLLLRPLAGAPEPTSSPTNMPDRMTVCRCNGVTKRDIVTSWSKGARTRVDIAGRTRATTGCGGCTDVVDGILEWLATSDPDTAAAPAPARGSRDREPGREEDVPGAKHRAHGAETSAG